MFARLRVCSFDPEGLPPAGEIHVAKVGFSKTGPVSISMDTWPVGAACRVGWPKFSKAGEIPAADPIRKGDSFRLILAPEFGHRHQEPQRAFYSCPLKRAWHFLLRQEDQLRRWKQQGGGL